jgi:ribonuclease D
VAVWRESRAAELDIPVRQVMPDIAVVAVAQRAPTSTAQLAELRGLDKRHTKSPVAETLIEAVIAGLEAPELERRDPRPAELPKHLRPVVSLITSWVAQIARDSRMDPALIATRSDVEALITEPPSGRLTEGWRSEMVGDPIRQLVTGEASLAFEDGKLVLEPRAT